MCVGPGLFEFAKDQCSHQASVILALENIDNCSLKWRELYYHCSENSDSMSEFVWFSYFDDAELRWEWKHRVCWSDSRIPKQHRGIVSPWWRPMSYSARCRSSQLHPGPLPRTAELHGGCSRLSSSRRHVQQLRLHVWKHHILLCRHQANGSR